jgi:hypothetical protein
MAWLQREVVSGNLKQVGPESLLVVDIRLAADKVDSNKVEDIEMPQLRHLQSLLQLPNPNEDASFYKLTLQKRPLKTLIWQSSIELVY